MMKFAFGFLAALCLVVHVAAGPAFAQSTIFRASIPFDFYAGDMKLSAGQYDASVVNGSVLSLRSKDGRSAATMTTVPFLDRLYSPTYGKFVFTRYGDYYFLRQVAWPGYEQGRELLKTNRELEVSRSGRPGDDVKIVGTAGAASPK